MPPYEYEDPASSFVIGEVRFRADAKPRFELLHRADWKLTCVRRPFSDMLVVAAIPTVVPVEPELTPKQERQ